MLSLKLAELTKNDEVVDINAFKKLMAKKEKWTGGLSVAA